MHLRFLQTILFVFLISTNLVIGQISPKFNIARDLLLVHFDCKTDVDDIHTAAALYTLLSQAPFNKINYHAVAGTYGVQEGLYVPGNDLFQFAFGKNWSDAHNYKSMALARVKKLAHRILKNQGDIFIAEAGQSDFSAALVRALKTDMPNLDLSKRIHLVQHSNWNEEVTTAADLEYVKKTIDYQKIPDGNVVGNGSPGFKTPGYLLWKDKTHDRKLHKVWEMAIDLGQKYNGKEGRYVNTAITENGVDFSDLSEVCWILGLQDLKDSDAFFDKFGY